MTEPTAEEKCGYCRRVQQSHKGNKGYKCKKHTWSFRVEKVRIYRQIDVDSLVSKARVDGAREERQKWVNNIVNLFQKDECIGSFYDGWNTSLKRLMDEICGEKTSHTDFTIKQLINFHENRLKELKTHIVDLPVPKEL